ncbi:MAG: hypothetical protein ACOX5G_00645 [Kiritimatiellia bacterium]|jgi:hypothetical protein
MEESPPPCAPILLVGFNRPDFLREQLRAIAPAKPGRVFLAVDGPRPDRPGEAARCEASRNAVHAIDWPCQVQTLFHPENLGCKYGPPAAITWFFSHVAAGIILEDDCRPTLDFLRFASELLARYAEDSRVGMISGNNHYGFQTNPVDSYRFSRDVSIWGWASWRRAWAAYEVEPECYRDEIDALLERSMQTRRGRRLKRAFFNRVLATKNTWDIQWNLSLVRENLLVVAPRANLVRNTGFIAASTHTGGFCADQPCYERTGTLAWPLVHPAEVRLDAKADRLHELRATGRLPRLLTVLGTKGGRPGRAVARLLAKCEPYAPGLFRL